MLSELCKAQKIKTFSLSAENATGEKGKGGMAYPEDNPAARELGVGWKARPCIYIQPGEEYTIADIKGMGAIKHIWITDNSPLSRLLVIRFYWDGCDKPSIEVPMGDFFASANHNEYRTLSSLAVCVNPRKGLNCYWEMPYRKGFKITVENIYSKTIQVYYQIDCEEKEIGEDALYLHAQFRRQNPLPYMSNYTILDNIKGRGQYVGTYMYWGVKSDGWWGEGEIKFYLDGDTDYPTICGTGTEDYFCGSYNFDVDAKYTEYTTPYAGLSKVDYSDRLYRSQLRFNLYRWHITDPIYFEKDIKVTIQALGWKSDERYLPLQDDISSVAYWYSDTLEDEYPTLPDRDGLEIV